MSSASPRLLESLAGWSSLCAGLLLICLVVLIHEGVRNQMLAHDLRIMEHKQSQWKEMAASQQAVIHDLKTDSKPLLERLALTQLHMQVAGTTPLNPPRPDPAGHVTSFDQLKAYETDTLTRDSLENILTPPLAPATMEVAPYSPPRTTLILLTTQVPWRDLLLAVGMGLVVLGLWPRRRTPAAGPA